MLPGLTVAHSPFIGWPRGSLTTCAASLIIGASHANRLRPPDPIAFRILPDGSPIPLQRLQYRKLAGCIGRYPAGILARAILEETNIEQYSGRLAEMRKLGFIVEAISQENLGNGDRRKLFRLHSSI